MNFYYAFVVARERDADYVHSFKYFSRVLRN